MKINIGRFPTPLSGFPHHWRLPDLLQDKNVDLAPLRSRFWLQQLLDKAETFPLQKPCNIDYNRQPAPKLEIKHVRSRLVILKTMLAHGLGGWEAWRL